MVKQVTFFTTCWLMTVFVLISETSAYRIEKSNVSSQGSTWLDRIKQDDDYEVCYTPGCLDAALDLISAINLSVDPCKDFYQFSCGNWLASNPVPPTGIRYGRPHVLYNKINEINQEILTSPPNSSDPKPVTQVKEFYKECLDEEKLETVGLEPLHQLLRNVGGWPLLNPSEWSADNFDLIESIGKIFEAGATPSIISAFVWRDIKNSTRNVIFLDQPSFGLPAFILSDQTGYESLIEAYRTYIIQVAKEMGTILTTEQLSLAAQEIIDFETQLANVSVPLQDRYETHLLHNPYLLNEFLAKMDAVDAEYSVDYKRLLDLIFTPVGVTISADEYISAAGEPYLTKVIGVLKDASPEVMANYLGWRVVAGLVKETTFGMRNITAQFDQALLGAAEPSIAPKPQVCAATSNYVFGMALGYKYVEQEFDREGKTLARQMVENLRTSFKELLNEADWLESGTLEEAQKKADAIQGLMAYPDWLDEPGLEKYYAGLELNSGEEAHFQNTINIAKWSLKKSLLSLRILNTEEEWVTDPAIVTAMYSAQHNSVTVPAGMLQPPFFGLNRPAFQNYGGIGVVMGHEITHGFDTAGAYFDGKGNAENWWDNVTRERFEEKAKCMEEQYGNYCFPSINMCVNGKITVGENIADNGGLRESFKAYRKYVESLGHEEGRLPGLEMLNPNQLFFISYANIRCESITDDGLIGVISSGPHSPNQFRVNGPMRNSMDFAETFMCPEDSQGMNPPKEEKCSIW